VSIGELQRAELDLDDRSLDAAHPGIHAPLRLRIAVELLTGPTLSL